ncbi:MAG TPA: MMPL family transporter, partial [Acidimicrobiales bacterium]|nr:MMPL family transporter [Acidimicrobiales bacterium]
MKPSSKPGRAGLTERLAAASARRPKRTLLLWGIAVVAALVLTGTTLQGLTTSEHVVGSTPSSQGEAIYRQVIGATAANRRPTDVIVVSSKSATVDDADFQRLVTRLIAQVRTSPGVTSVGTDLGPGSPLVSSTGHAAMIDLRAGSDADIKPVVEAVRSANGTGGFAVAVTGTHTVANDFTTLSTSDLHRGELDFGLPIALVILILVFGAVVAGLMPVAIALISIIVGLGIASIVSQEFSLSIFVLNMMIGMGLALGIDYSLFVVSRFREERGNGLDKEAAVRRTGATASRAVLFSGSTFVVALCAMFLVRTNVLRSLAAGAIIVGIVSVVAALTLLPAILSLMGDRINALRVPFVGKNLGRADASEAKTWRAMIDKVTRRPAISLALAGGFMVLAAAPILGLHIGQSGVATLPDTLPSKQGYLALQANFPNQHPNPVEIVAVAGTATAHADADLAALDTTLTDDPRFGRGTIQVSSNGKLLALTVPIRGDAVSSQDVAAVSDLRQHLIPSA